MEKKKVVGIDLGTTNSVIAALESGQPFVIVDDEGQRTTPSVLAYTRKGEPLLGYDAKRQGAVNPENTFFSIKRFMGAKEGDVPDRTRKLPYKVIKDKDNNIKIHCPSLKKDFSPQEISAQILRKLINQAKNHLKQEVKQAVITVPAYFNDAQRQATIDAGKIADIEVLRIINEPTAASLAYGLDKNRSETVLVFDLGGGTFDVSILEVGEGIFEVLATSGDTNLGGDDFDYAIAQWLMEDFKKKKGIDLSDNMQSLQRLLDASEKAKVELSSAEKTKIAVPFIFSDKTGPQHLEKEITRETFEELVKDLIYRCRIIVEKTLNDSMLKKQDLDQIVLVGGSTRIPAVKELVYSLTEKKSNQSVNPDEVVAIGAAIQAGILAGEIDDILLLDVTPLSLGVETIGGIMATVIERNTTVPVKKTEQFSTAIDDQPNVEIHVLQGERELVEGNKSLGHFMLNGIPAAKRGVPRIAVTFDIDPDGILSVKAKEKDTGIEQSVTIHGASKLNEKEVEKMITEAEEFSKIDKEKREKIELKNQAEILCVQAEEELALFTEIMPKENSEEIRKIIDNIRKKVQENDFQTLKSEIENLKTKMSEMTALKTS